MVRRGQEAVVRWRLTVARRAGRHAALVANGGCLAQIWQSRPQMGSAGPNGLWRARALCFVVRSAGVSDDTTRVRTAARPMCYSRAAGALRARLGPAGPAWAWCAPAALFSQ
jgi:hypothetical protein